MQINDIQTNTAYLSDNNGVFWRPSTQPFQDNLTFYPPQSVVFSMIPSLWKHTPSILLSTEFYFIPVFSTRLILPSLEQLAKSVWLRTLE